MAQAMHYLVILSAWNNGITLDDVPLWYTQLALIGIFGMKICDSFCQGLIDTNLIFSK